MQDITGADIERSRMFLESSNWNLETALGTFFEAGEPGDVEAAAAAPAPPAAEKPSPARRDAGNIRTIESSDEEDSDSDMVAHFCLQPSAKDQAII